MKINTFKKHIEKINNQDIVDQYIAFNAMKKLLDIELKDLKEEIIKTKKADNKVIIFMNDDK